MSQPKPKPTQWLFAELLRPLLQDYYEVLTNVPVGDAPRAADILLVRRTSEEPTPFRGLWRFLTTWNVVEFKGPTVSARGSDLHRLVELGLGIHRRQNEDRRRQGEAALETDATSFWYIVPRIGNRFLPLARKLLPVEEMEAGLWRSQVMGHLVFLVSSETFATEPDSVPLHLLLKRPEDEERALAHLVLEKPHYWEWYASALSLLHPVIWEEISHMATSKRKGLEYDFTGVVRDIGLDKFVKSVGAKKVIEAIGPEKIVDEMGVDWFLANLPPAQLKKLKERLK